MTLEQINTRLEDLKVLRAQVKGQETEVYSRIVGYYRSVKNWNKGKKEEYGIRVNYADYKTPEIKDKGNESTPVLSLVEENKSQKELLFTADEETVNYLYFYRETCPNCPPVAAWLENSGFEGRNINVDRESGMHEALRYDINAAPTVVFLNKKGNETGRGSSVAQLENQFVIAAAAGA
ncbi:MAG: hypothetical protein DRZ90_04160 [Spirochaetes bacterium]|nr:MAG: hypothetical protein DRZ90_04160 [Spirochaetota bacterium]